MADRMNTHATRNEMEKEYLDLVKDNSRKHKEIVRLKKEVKSLTAVHTFDPDNKETWPEVGSMVIVAVYSELPGTRSRLQYVTAELIHNWKLLQKSSVLWSEHAPSLQAHLKSLEDTNQ